MSDEQEGGRIPSKYEIGDQLSEMLECDYEVQISVVL